MPSSAQEMVLAPAPASAGLARRFVGRALDSVGAGSSREVGVLLTSEVVTNALLYAQSRIVVRVSTDDASTPASVRVEVEDASPHRLRERHVGVDATSGRGLSIVARLAERWGVDDVEGDGKVVWFEVPRK